jgi:hypothetical protein
MMKHIHHIIPRYRCDELGINPDFPENLIELSVEEHAEAHRILWEGGGRKEDYVAWKGLTEQIGKEEIFLETSRIGGLNNRGKSKSKEHRKKLGDALRGRTYEEMMLEFSEERKKKISESMKGNKNSQNHSSDEYKRKQSEAMKKACAKRKLKKA